MIILLLGCHLVDHHYRLLLGNEILLEKKLLIIGLVFLQNVVQIDLVCCLLLGVIKGIAME
jgi:hypothetical protein